MTSERAKQTLDGEEKVATSGCWLSTSRALHDYITVIHTPEGSISGTLNNPFLDPCVLSLFVLRSKLRGSRVASLRLLGQAFRTESQQIWAASHSSHSQGLHTLSQSFHR